MALSLALFFGVIITVNLTMAYYANSTWSGLVVKNSYVASQEFNGKVEQVKAQEALGWKGSLTSTPGTVRWSLVDADGKDSRFSSANDDGFLQESRIVKLFRPASVVHR